MKNILKSLLAAVLIVAPAASYGQNFTGKTLKKSLVSASAADAPQSNGYFENLIEGVSTPCYAILQATDLDDLLQIGIFFGTGQGDSNPILDMQAKGSTLIAISLLNGPYDEATIFAFLREQLKFIYDCEGAISLDMHMN